MHRGESRPVVSLGHCRRAAVRLCYVALRAATSAAQVKFLDAHGSPFRGGGCGGGGVSDDEPRFACLGAVASLPPRRA